MLSRAPAPVERSAGRGAPRLMLFFEADLQLGASDVPSHGTRCPGAEVERIWAVVGGSEGSVRGFGRLRDVRGLSHEGFRCCAPMIGVEFVGLLRCGSQQETHGPGCFLES